MSSVPAPPPAGSRALVVEPDEAVRRRVSAGLREQGMEVVECGNVTQGRELYCGQRLVVAPLNGSNEDMKAFVAWVRAEAGLVQPWIIALGTNHRLAPGETPAQYGVNDLLTAPMDAGELVRQLETAGLGRPLETVSGSGGSSTSNGSTASKTTAPALSARSGSDPEAGSVFPSQNHTPAAPVSLVRPPSYHRPSGIRSKTSWRGASAAVILENFPAAVAVLDRSLVFVAANQQWISDFQLTELSLPGLPLLEVFPNLHPNWLELYQSCLAGGACHAGEDVMQRADGTEGPVHWEILTWRESHGLIGGLVLTCAPVRIAETSPPLPALSEAGSSLPFPLSADEPDFSENPEPESLENPGPPADSGPPAAQETSAADPTAADSAFREIAEAAPFGMVLLGDEAQVLYANPQHGALLGCGIPESGGMAEWLNRACPGEEDARRTALDEWWETVWTRHNPLTCSLRTTGGLVKEIIFRPVPLPGDRLLLTLSDVTDARLDEQAVRSSEARHRGLFQQSGAACAMMNVAGNVTDVNAAFETLTGFSKQEIRRASLGDFLPPAAVHRMRPPEGGIPEPFPSIVTHRSGKTTPVIIAVSSLFNEQGIAICTACTLVPALPPAAEASPAGAAAQGLAATSSEARNPLSATPVPAIALNAVPLIRTYSDTEWGSLTADLLFLLDEGGRVLDHNWSRDFQGFVPPEKHLHGQLLESALPGLTARLPLDDMTERLLDDPAQEVRCVFPLGPEQPEDEEESERLLEARMVRVPVRPARQPDVEALSQPDIPTPSPTVTTATSAAPLRFALSIRDVSASGGQPTDTDTDIPEP